jgi:hypothetical protein
MAAWYTVQPKRAAEDIYQNVGAPRFSVGAPRFSVGSGETAYDVTLRDLARTHSAGLARGVADGLLYTTDSQFPEEG